MLTAFIHLLNIQGTTPLDQVLAKCLHVYLVMKYIGTHRGLGGGWQSLELTACPWGLGQAPVGSP